MGRKIILFELNEVPFRIIDEYCKWRPESAFARRLSECYQYETYTEDIGSLSPWITWPTLHRGINNDKHMVHDFGQDLSDVNQEYPNLWQILTASGVPTGVCGSLHTYPMPEDLENYSFFLPDTFAAGSECFPKSLSLFQEFNLIMARESARNVSTRVPWANALKLLASASELGFKLRTFADVGYQLLSERMHHWKTTRRRTYQTVLAFDVFMKQLQKTKPAFCTFFTNHVASSMHRFWAAAFPTDYQVFGYDNEWVNTYSHEIDFTMGKFDAFFSDLIAFADRNPEYVIWVATSMGQAATVALPLETQLYVTDLNRYMSALGLNSTEWKRMPAMLPQVNVAVSAAKVDDFRATLQSMMVDGQPQSFREAANGFFSMDFGQQNLYNKESHIVLNGQVKSFEEMGMANVEIKDKSGASAYHIPQGTLLVYDPRNRQPKNARPQVSTVEIAPTILRNFGVDIPEYMKRPVKIGAA